jgi:hypothetical protein
MNKELVALDSAMAFCEGALNINMSRAHDGLEEGIQPALEVPIQIFFPSETAEDGWFEDSLKFDSLAVATEFFHNVHLLISVARDQQRAPHNEGRLLDTEDQE